MDQIANKAATMTQMSAEAYLIRLKERGVDVVFANAGTDFAPIIEAMARGDAHKFPRFVVAPHENLAMAMANGYYRITGKPAGVMVHVTVGTSNTVNMLMNMSRDNVPVILAAGRTPITETGHAASRNGAIHWGQEVFDQGLMVREFVKWDYELRAGQPVAALIDRAVDIAMSEPRGPVYLALPREVLADEAVPMRRDNVRPMGATAPVPSAEAIAEAAALLAGAKKPLIVTSALGRSVRAFDALTKFANDHAVPVVQPFATDLSVATDHPMHIGFDLGSHLDDADVVVVINSAVPWMPRMAKPKATTKVIHIGNDPLVARFPFREYEADLVIAGDGAAALDMLGAALAKANIGKDVLDARRKAAATTREEAKAALEKLAMQVKDQTPIHPAWLAYCLNEQKAKDAIVVNELGTSPARLDLTEPLSYIGTSLAGGLGAALGSALGAKLAAPKREVICCLGDGSYMFGNPTPYHFVGRAEGLPTMTIVANNHTWLAVKQSTLAVYPDGAASKANTMQLADLNPSPAFEKVAEACGAHGESVEDPAKLPEALKRCFEKLRAGQPVLLNVHTQGRR